jgi:predicted ATPase
VSLGKGERAEIAHAWFNGEISMAHITSFAIDALAGRTKQFASNLNRHVNIFFGLNGSGKTSLLRILHSALEGDASPLRTVPFRHAEIVVYSQDYGREFRYVLAKGSRDAEKRQRMLFAERSTEVDRIRRPLRVSTRSPFEWKISPEPPEGFSGRWHHAYLPTSRLLQWRRRMAAEQRSEVMLDEQYEDLLTRHWLDFFGAVQANVRASQQRCLVEILLEVLRGDQTQRATLTLTPQSAYQRMVAFLRRQDPGVEPTPEREFKRRFEESPLFRGVLAHIDRVEDQIESAMAPSNKLQSLVARLFTGNKQLKFGPRSIDVVTADNEDIGLRSLSSGEKHILRILIEMAQVGHSTLLIDEPEISMHLDWQRELIPAMRELNKDGQLVIATHSPEMMADQPDSVIFRL